MRVLLLLTLYNVFNVILAQFDIVNKDLGDVHFQAAVGNMPLKYIPLSKQDQKVSDKVSDKAADFIDSMQLEYNEPLHIPALPRDPIDIDIPFLFLRGKVFVHSLVVDGAFKQLALHGFELRLNNLRADMNITIPKLYLEAQIHLKASIGFMPIMFNGHLRVNLFDVGIAVTTGGVQRRAPRVGEALQIEAAIVKVDIRNVVFNFTMDSEEDGYEENYEEYEDEDSPVRQSFINLVCTGSSIHGNILKYLLKSALDMYNKILYDVPMDFFKKYLLSDIDPHYNDN